MLTLLLLFFLKGLFPWRQRPFPWDRAPLPQTRLPRHRHQYIGHQSLFHLLWSLRPTASAASVYFPQPRLCHHGLFRSTESPC